MSDGDSSLMFSTTEAATLAHGCLALSSGKAAGKLTVLRTLAIELDPGEVSEAPVNKAIDERIVNVFRSLGDRKIRARRMVDESAILYILCTHLIALHLDSRTKRTLYNSIDKMRNELAHRSTRILLDDYVSFDPGAKFLAWRHCIAHYAKARGDHVVRDPEIMGGVPTVRGTRIPVHSLAARIDGGDSLDEIKQDYPHLKQEALLAALAYAKANPKVGRPSSSRSSGVRLPWDK